MKNSDQISNGNTSANGNQSPLAKKIEQIDRIYDLLKNYQRAYEGSRENIRIQAYVKSLQEDIFILGQLIIEENRTTRHG